MSETAKEVRKVDFLTEEEAAVYNLSKDEAMAKLKETGVSESEQMLNKWCRDGDIDAVRISKGAPANRGIKVSEESLKAFIYRKNGNVQQLLEELKERDATIADLKEQLKKANAKIREMRNEGIVVPKKAEYKFDEFTAMVDPMEVSFRSTVNGSNAGYKALFNEDGNVVEVFKRGRGRAPYAPVEVDDDFKKALAAKYQEYLESVNA